MKEKIQEIRNSRLDICRVCPKNSTPDKVGKLSYCQECGCNLLAKSSAFSSSCPLDKWREESDAIDEVDIKNILHERRNDTEGDSEVPF